MLRFVLGLFSHVRFLKSSSAGPESNLENAFSVHVCPRMRRCILVSKVSAASGVSDCLAGCVCVYVCVCVCVCVCVRACGGASGVASVCGLRFVLKTQR